jgi:hypothetical protein
VVNFLFAFLTTGPPAFLLLLTLARDLFIPKKRYLFYNLFLDIINFVYTRGIEENVPEELIFKTIDVMAGKSTISFSQLTKLNPVMKFTIGSHLDFATALLVMIPCAYTLS